MERCKIVCLIVVMEFIDCLLVNRMLMNFIVSVLFIFEYIFVIEKWNGVKGWNFVCLDLLVKILFWLKF